MNKLAMSGSSSSELLSSMISSNDLILGFLSSWVLTGAGLEREANREELGFGVFRLVAFLNSSSEGSKAEDLNTRGARRSSIVLHFGQGRNPFVIAAS